MRLEKVIERQQGFRGRLVVHVRLMIACPSRRACSRCGSEMTTSYEQLETKKAASPIGSSLWIQRQLAEGPLHHTSPRESQAQPVRRAPRRSLLATRAKKQKVRKTRTLHGSLPNPDRAPSTRPSRRSRYAPGLLWRREFKAPTSRTNQADRRRSERCREQSL
jgi:hypothetical protein